MEIAGVTITHPDRLVYSKLRLTKLDIARYYARVAPLMLPHIKGRPLALLRCPEGIGSPCFFQKHWVGKLPDAIDTVMITQSDRKRHPHVVINDVVGLVTLAQWGVLELHLWGARADDVEHPDRIVFDLDPAEGVRWNTVLEGAQILRHVLDELGLKSWIKLTGGKGLHIVVPINRRSDWPTVKAFAEAVANLLVREAPDRFIAKAAKSARRGKIFIDWLRNARGASWVAPWSLRARPEAGISAPFAWAKLKSIKSPLSVSLSKPLRLPANDPWVTLLKTKQGLSRAMIERLS